jgi:hypothetical protein
VTSVLAARAAARIRKDLKQEVEKVSGHYGEFVVLVDGKTVVEGGALAFLGVLPSVGSVVDAVRKDLGPS